MDKTHELRSEELTAFSDEELADFSDEGLVPDVRYKKYYHDLPKQYCCRAMREGIEDLEFVNTTMSTASPRITGIH